MITRTAIAFVLISAPALGYELPAASYRGSFATIANWHVPSPMPRPAPLYWGSYLFSANSPLHSFYKARQITIVRAGVVQSAIGHDLDCSDMAGPVAISGPDLHRLDADNDGIGCEWTE